MLFIEITSIDLGGVDHLDMPKRFVLILNIF